MKRSDDDQELVLDTCPQLVSLHIDIWGQWDEEYESDDDYDGIIRSLTLDMPSLENLTIGHARTVKKCTLKCPKLVAIVLTDCWRMVALKFDNGTQLHNLKSESRLPSSGIVDKKKQVISYVFFFVFML